MSEEPTAIQLLSDKIKDQSLELQFERRITDLEKSNKQKSEDIEFLKSYTRDLPSEYAVKNISSEFEYRLKEDIGHRFTSLYAWFFLASIFWAFVTGGISWLLTNA